MFDDQAVPIEVSRRTLLAASVAVPALGGSQVRPSRPLVARCAEWMSTDLQIDRLSLRWAALETEAAREAGWLDLPPLRRPPLAYIPEMDAIERELKALAALQPRRLKVLTRTKASDLHGVASKLAVAARLLAHEGGPALALVADAVRDLSARRCPDCGARYVLGAEHP